MNTSIFNFSHWFIGVVEDRNDPEMLGRCRVRVFGHHTDSKELLRTRDLPWAIPIQPITSAGVSGVGSSPLGPMEGSWVVGFFLDGEDMQQPAMIGTISSKVGMTTFPETQPRSTTHNPNDGVLRGPDGEPVRDSSGSTVRVGTRRVEGWELGQTSEQYESGGRGPGTINPYLGTAQNDFGGASYGIYQFASYMPPVMGNGRSRPSGKNSPVLQFIRNSNFASNFEGLTPGTDAFDTAWRNLSNQQSERFREEQHEYIKRKYYDVCIANVQRNGIDLSIYGPGVQDLVWSTAVQLGPNKSSVFVVPLRGKPELTDRDIIKLVSKYKIDNVNALFASSPQSIRDSVRNRWVQEEQALLGLIA